MAVDAGVYCLLTRPAHQSATLEQMLRLAGFGVISFPTIAIEASPDNETLSRLDHYLRAFDILLFVSRNAVDYCFRRLSRRELPAHLQLGVIGKGSQQALENWDVKSSIKPADSYNSEGLLGSDMLQQVQDKNILIVRGQEGRNLLGDTLAQRGGRVEYMEVYRRKLPDYGNDYFQRLTADHYPDLAIFTSSEGIRNCFQLLKDSEAERLRNIPWLLISERMRETASDLRHNAEVIIAHGASDQGLLDALLEWQQQNKNRLA